jgi:hypothetical protein
MIKLNYSGTSSGSKSSMSWTYESGSTTSETSSDEVTTALLRARLSFTINLTEAALAACSMTAPACNRAELRVVQRAGAAGGGVGETRAIEGVGVEISPTSITVKAAEDDGCGSMTGATIVGGCR